ncbi:MAG TPA: polyprenyl synthetase family protein [Phycisphaerales bacterium]|nr:polyprenyl synthetase family protein [Phycisphaerales bacterium]
MVIAPLEELKQDIEKVEAELQSVVRQRAGALRSAAEMMFCTGGKRLRPALVILVAKLFGAPKSGIYRIAAAIEMIHGASLIHDDVIDSTEVRRGAPTMNAIKGNQFSVLLGDFLLCQALLAVSELGRVDLLQVISQGVADMTQGQILEAQFQGDVTVSEETYMEVVDGKTSALMAAGCKLAALYSDATPAQVQAASDFGRNLGHAFQIVDDILDIWGDPAVLGKPVGSDLQEQKYTLPFLMSYGSSAEDEREEVHKLLANGSYPGEHIPELVKWMDRHQGRARASERATQYTLAAQSALEVLPVSKARDDLAQLVDFLVERQK